MLIPAGTGALILQSEELVKSVPLPVASVRVAVYLWDPTPAGLLPERTTPGMITTELLSALSMGFSGSVIHVVPLTMILYSYVPGAKFTVVEKLPSAPFVILILPLAQSVNCPAR
ncbi:hypothetical protein D3C73_1138010 [compost metagenome]